MRCAVCGREAMNPEANYCDYCGSPFKRYGSEGWNTRNTTSSGYEERVETDDGYSAFGMSNQSRKEVRSGNNGNAMTGNQDKIGVMTFLGVMLLPFIPGVGSIAYLVILFYWSFAAGIDGTRKSFARATLIFTAIMVVVVMMVAGMLLAAWPELAEMGGL